MTCARFRFVCSVACALVVACALASTEGFARDRSKLERAQTSRAARLAAPDSDPEVTTIYRGKLGSALIQLSLAAKPDEPGGYAGEYFVFGGGATVLVGGEIEDDVFYLEESEDGTAISGWWDGKVVVEANRGFIVGTWLSADEKQTRPFKLERVMRTRTAIKRQT